MRRSKADKYNEQISSVENEALTIEELAAKMCDQGKHKKKEERSLNPTQAKVIFSKAKVNAYMGAAGAAKSSSIVAAGFLRALFQPGSVGVIGRYDYNKLLMTTKLTAERILKTLPPGTLLHKTDAPPACWTIRPIRDGAPSKIFFMGMKDEQIGFEIDWAAIDEANEVEEKRINELLGRLRNIPEGFTLEDDPTTLFLAFNPPDNTHWLYTACTGLDHKGRHVAKPSMTLFTPEYKENAQNLRRGYYEDLEAGYENAPDLRDRFVRGLWGTTFPGDPVYRQFSRLIHVKRDLPWDPHALLFRFWDFGYNAPACIWAQLDLRGRLLVLHELIGSKIEIEDLADEVKNETTQRFLGQRERIVDFGDPAVRQKKDTGSTLAKLSKKGIQMNYRITTINYGVRRIRELLNQLVDGEPVLQFDEVGCPILINAMLGGYRLEDKPKAETGEIEPKKDGYYDHPADAYRYGVVNLLGGGESSSSPASGGQDMPGNLGYGGHY